MDKILFCWEFGGGHGHLLPYSGLFRHFRSSGHEVFFAVKELTNLNLLTAGDANVLQAPQISHAAPEPVVVNSYAHLLWNLGYSNPRIIQQLILSWNTIFDLTKPDIVLFNHSPSALLAARERTFKTIQIGTGFFVPPQTQPLPCIKYWEHCETKELQDVEDKVVNNINSACRSINGKMMTSLSELFTADENILHTYKELDHYPARDYAQYYGELSDDFRGEAPRWKSKEGKRIFLYLKPSKLLPKLFALINDLDYSVVAYCPDISNQFKNSHPAISFHDGPIDIAAVCSQCDLAILNANHATMVKFLLSSIPLLSVPLTLEQAVLARRASEMGVSETVQASASKKELQQVIQRLLTDESYRAAASAFAKKYGQGDEQAEKRTAELANQIATGD